MQGNHVYANIKGVSMHADVGSLPLRVSHTTSAVSNNLDDCRNSFMKDVALSVPLVPLSYFKDHLLPPLHDQLDISAIVDRLWKAKDIYKPDAEDGSTETPKKRWTLFPADPVASKKFKEDAVFSPFAQLANVVAKQAKSLFYELGVDPAPEQTVTFLCNPTMTPESTNRHNSSKPDSYGVLVERSVDTGDEKKAPHWDDIVVPGEKKKRSRAADFNDNSAKLLWSLHHAMRETVYRRFIFGYTIENTQMRLWFCSRSNIIVSDTFNFITDHETLVHFFLSIMFAPLSRLGYDPTIGVAKRTKDQKTTKYSINVRGQDGREATYITDEVVANISAEALQGRATRVWRGKKADANGHSIGHNMVIKDCWIDTSREREGDILASILEAAKKSPNPKHLPRIKEHFLTVVQHGDVFIDGEQDNTCSVLRGGVEFPEPKKFLDLQCSSKNREVIKPPVGLVTVDQATVDWLRNLRLYQDKFHYRIVFDSEEDCDPIDKLTSGRKIWYALGGALIGLGVLHQLGFVHRDISAGNVLVGRGIAGSKGGTGKIVDLEFCKHVDNNKPAHQGRTGTRYFIPVEVESKRYMFGPTLGTAATDPEHDFADTSKLMDEDDDHPRSATPDMDTQSSDSYSAPMEAPAIVYNPLHDLESLWWLAVYLVLPRPLVQKQTDTKGKTRGEKSKEEHQDKEQRSATIFTTARPPVEQRALQLLINHDQRCATFINPVGFTKTMESAHEHLNFIVTNLDKARTCLRNAYIIAEAGLYTTGVHFNPAFSNIYNQLSTVFVNAYRSTPKELEFESMPISFVHATTATISSNPVDPKLQVGLPDTKKHPRDDPNGDNRETSVRRITACMEALRSPTRAGTSRDLRRARYEEEEDGDDVEEDSDMLPALQPVDN
ncbi:hypothetical protein BDY19DRAFT_1074371 [Irpex rosettiformis]|uniref:Uncharacterized protein n=1 Tax=Irpex rosettiformis TaxID=378272 RepID=A0ACB8TY58_9APHY|nr:hypothetical protein BDY19DRAFT_1074371 [Irpex rosettiformis]